MKAKIEFKSLPNELKNLIINRVENSSCEKLVKVNRDTRNRCFRIVPFLQKIDNISMMVCFWKSQNKQILCNTLSIEISKDKESKRNRLQFHSEIAQVHTVGAVIGNENQKLFQQIKASKTVFIRMNSRFHEKEFDENGPKIEFLKFFPRNWHTFKFTLVPVKFDVIRQVFEHTKPTIECQLGLNTGQDLRSLGDEEIEYLKSLMSRRFPNTISFYSGYSLREMHEILKFTNIQLYEAFEERWENFEKTVKLILNKGLPSRNEKMILTVTHLIFHSDLEPAQQTFDELFVLLQDKNFSCALIEDKNQETQLLNVFEKREENLFGKRIHLNGSSAPVGAFVKQRFFRRTISPEMNYVYMAAMQENHNFGEVLHDVVFGAKMERIVFHLSL